MKLIALLAFVTCLVVLPGAQASSPPCPGTPILTVATTPPTYVVVYECPIPDTATWGYSSQDVASECTPFIPAVGVLGQQVPFTGTTDCSPEVQHDGATVTNPGEQVDLWICTATVESPTPTCVSQAVDSDPNCELAGIEHFLHNLGLNAVDGSCTTE
jgi:hypothetical protein